MPYNQDAVGRAMGRDPGSRSLEAQIRRGKRGGMKSPATDAGRFGCLSRYSAFMPEPNKGFQPGLNRTCISADGY
jgi:hypothetical protein